MHLNVSMAGYTIATLAPAPLASNEVICMSDCLLNPACMAYTFRTADGFCQLKSVTTLVNSTKSDSAYTLNINGKPFSMDVLIEAKSQPQTICIMQHARSQQHRQVTAMAVQVLVHGLM